jgi:aminoglycoside phosphotransferase (APT) family kinase protein
MAATELYANPSAGVATKEQAIPKCSSNGSTLASGSTETEHLLVTETSNNEEAHNLGEDTNDDEDASDTSSEAVSFTSTLHYDQVPFEEFRTKVLDLSRQLWPSKDANEFQIERLHGGSSHRVVRVKFKSSTSQPTDSKEHCGWVSKFVQSLSTLLIRLSRRSKPESNSVDEEYILRIPRFDDDLTFESDFALLRLLEGVLTFPIPKVLKFDDTLDNPLNKPYVLQPRVPGKTLDNLWEELNHAQKLCIAREVAEFLSQLTRKSHPCAGRVDPASIPPVATPQQHQPVRMLQFKYTFLTSSATNINEPAEVSSPSDFLQDRFRSWKAHRKAKGIQDFVPWDALSTLVGQLNDNTSVFGSEDDYYLCHGDFYPRNIMAKILDDTAATITAILDWDGCVFAPATVAFKFPSWLWAWDKYESGELEARKLHLAELDTPRDNDARDIRQIFEAGMRPMFLRYANDPQGDVARWLWHFAVDGIYESDVWDLAEEVLEEYGLDPLVIIEADEEDVEEEQISVDGEENIEFEEEVYEGKTTVNEK